jgi:hypothetical protein
LKIETHQSRVPKSAQKLEFDQAVTNNRVAIAKATVFSHFSHPYQRRPSGEMRGDPGGMRRGLSVASRIEESIFARRIGLKPTLTAGSHRVITGVRAWAQS